MYNNDLMVILMASDVTKKKYCPLSALFCTFPEALAQFEKQHYNT